MSDVAIVYSVAIVFAVFKWLSLAGVPTAAAAILWRRRLKRPAFVALAACEALFVLAVVCWTTTLATTSTAINVAFCFAAWLAWGVLVAACLWATWTLKPPLVGIIAGALLTLVAAPVAMSGLLLGYFALSEVNEPPMRVAEIRPGLSCRVESWGGFAPSGFSVRLYHAWLGLPALRVEVARADATDPQTTCESVAAASGY